MTKQSIVINCIHFIIGSTTMLFFSPQGQASEQLQLSDVLSEQEAKELDLANASDEKKKAFALWLEKWTRTVIEQAPTYHPSQSISTWIKSWPAHVKPKNDNTKQTDIEESLKTANLRIFRNQNGEKIYLKDGSIWEIVPFDRTGAKYWQRDDMIEIEKSTRDLTRPYTLINKTRDEKAAAKVILKPSSTYECPQDSSSYYSNSHNILLIDIRNTQIKLSNNSQWKIAPVDQKTVELTWKTKDRVRVERSRDSVYTSQLINLDSGSTIKAIEIKK